MTTKERYAGILKWFAENVPAPESELHYRDPYQLLVAVILSAQCTDRRVNITTPALFERFPTPRAMSEVEADEIYPYIKSISYPNNKARNLAAMARRLVEEHDGVVPAERDELMRLPGVGRKTANVIGAVLFDRPVMAVDTHVFRVARRIGLAPESARTPLAVELRLTANIAPELIPRAHHWLILHGRYVCTARKPHCPECGIAPWCAAIQLKIEN
ncbi:MAG: endonuclease III [Alistipes sp.]|nr:endonuclease III [Alistipes sp.]